MRSLVLNTASVSGLSVDRGALSPWLREVVTGMGRLVDHRVAQPQLRSREGIHRTLCLPQVSLFDVARDLLRTGSKDEYEFFLTIAGRAPWTEGLRPESVERFRACEERTLSPGDGEPLMLCVIIGGIAVGFPSSSFWDTDRVSIRFDELLPDGSVRICTEEIDNLTRSAHSRAIAGRHRAALRSSLDAVELWQKRTEVFPHLLFGPEVENHLKSLGGLLVEVARKLGKLDAAVEDWKRVGGPAPSWPFRVSPESERVNADPALIAARRFRSSRGGSPVFEWHARYSDGGRIHFRFDSATRELEIGYIGPHLPL